MTIYIIVGRQYGIISSFFTEKQQAQNYLKTISNLYQDNWRIVTMQKYY